MRTSDIKLSLWISIYDKERLLELRRRLQERADTHHRVSEREVILEALEKLTAYLDRLDKDQGRRR